MLFSSWSNLTHVYMDAETKELVKEQFSILSVPFAIAVNCDGAVLAEGDPKVVDFVGSFAAQSNKPTISFDEDF